MGTVEEIQGSIVELNASLVAVDTKLDEVRAFIVGLQAQGSGVTQAQLQAILDGVNGAKNVASTVLAEADALDEVPNP